MVVETLNGEMYVKTCRRSVTTAGTPEPFETGNPNFYKVKACTIRADATNTGNLYVGDSNRVSSTDYSYILAPGETVSLNVMDSDRYGDKYIYLTQIWIDADTDGNALSFIALTDVEPW